jgi:hypothetical protein
MSLLNISLSHLLQLRKALLLQTFFFLCVGPIAVFLLACCVPDACSAGVPQTHLVHSFASFFLENSSFPLEVNVYDPAGITEVRCYFRFDSSGPFVYSEMTGGKDAAFTTTLPAAIASVQKIEYIFLVVNGQKQAIISSLFTLNKADTGNRTVISSQHPDKKYYHLLADIEGAETVKDFLLQPSTAKISRVSPQKHYGVLAGLYSKEQIGCEVAEGYFGAFRLDAQNKIMPIKGYIVLRHSCDSFMPQKQQALAQGEIASFPATTGDDEVISAPDIAGDNWKGYFWRSDFWAGTFVPITATVTQTKEGVVTLITSKEGIGHDFSGNIDITGHMVMTDSFDNEVWSTFEGPATEVYIKIEDYVEPPSLPDKPDPPRYLIKLTRAPKPQPPPAIIQAISLLLL